MTYAIGDPVVFADHGATRVHQLCTRVIAGIRREYVVLRYPFSQPDPDVVATVPVDGGLVAPLADVVGPTGVGEALALLAVPGPHRESRYPERRRRLYLIKLGGLDDETDADPTLDIREVAEVVRNLTYRQRAQGLPDAERDLLEAARMVLISEVALAEDLDPGTATAVVDTALRAQQPAL